VGIGDVAGARTPSKGLNYCWSVMEGTHCYGGAEEVAIRAASSRLPVLEYDHINGQCERGRAANFYRGTQVTHLTGLYLYDD